MALNKKVIIPIVVLVPVAAVVICLGVYFKSGDSTVSTTVSTDAKNSTQPAGTQGRSAETGTSELDLAGKNKRDAANTKDGGKMSVVVTEQPKVTDTSATVTTTPIKASSTSTTTSGKKEVTDTTSTGNSAPQVSLANAATPQTSTATTTSATAQTTSQPASTTNTTTTSASQPATANPNPASTTSADPAAKPQPQVPKTTPPTGGKGAKQPKGKDNKPPVTPKPNTKQQAKPQPAPVTPYTEEEMKKIDLGYNLDRSLPCFHKFADDLENKGVKFDDDTELMASLEAEHLSKIPVEDKYKNTPRGPFYSRIFVYNGVNNTINNVAGDIAAIGTDAIVNAANEGCDGGGGIDGAIHDACDDKDPHKSSDPLKSRVLDLFPRLPKGGRCPTGSARIVSVAGFPENRTLHKGTKFILQAVGPTGSSARREALLRSTYISTLNNARDLGVRHVAFNCISTAIFGYPRDEGAEVAVSTVRRWMEMNPESKLKVVFVLFHVDYAKQIVEYKKVIPKYFPFNE